MKFLLLSLFHYFSSKSTKYTFSKSLKYCNIHQCSPLQEEASLRGEQCKLVYLPLVLLTVHNRHYISIKKYKTKNLISQEHPKTVTLNKLGLLFFLKNGKHIKRGKEKYKFSDKCCLMQIKFLAQHHAHVKVNKC